MEIGSTGVWFRTDSMTAGQTAAFAKRIEGLGYSALWFPEILARNSFVQAGWLLSATERLIVATGIANIYLREAYATATAQRTLAEQSSGRFLLGLGISHGPVVEGMLGKSSKGPVEALQTYLETMARAVYEAPAPEEEPPRGARSVGTEAPRTCR